VQYYCEGLDFVSPWRMWAAAFGYLLRPSILYYILVIFIRRKSDGFRYLMSIPLVLTAACAFAAFFTEKSFYYTAENVLVRGPLIATPFVVSAFYFVWILGESIRKIRLGDTQETVMLMIVLLIAGLATYLEAALRFSGLLSGFSMVGVIMYYLYFMIDSYTHDQMTDAYRRERMYQDFHAVQKNFGVITFDMNDLKKINDTQGHWAGDKAIAAISHAAEGCMNRRSRLYRIGGDEFAVIVNADRRELVQVLEQKIRRAVANTGYSIAIGSTLAEEDESLESAMQRADEYMYRDKRRIKGKDEVR